MVQCIHLVVCVVITALNNALSLSLSYRKFVLVRIMTRIVRHNECFCIIKALKGQKTGLTGCINAYEKMHPVISCIISSIEREYHISTQKAHFSLRLYESFGPYQHVKALPVHLLTPFSDLNMYCVQQTDQNSVTPDSPIICGTVG